MRGGQTHRVVEQSHGAVARQIGGVVAGQRAIEHAVVCRGVAVAVHQQRKAVLLALAQPGVFDGLDAAFDELGEAGAEFLRLGSGHRLVLFVPQRLLGERAAGQRLSECGLDLFANGVEIAHHLAGFRGGDELRGRLEQGLAGVERLLHFVGNALAGGDGLVGAGLYRAGQCGELAANGAHGVHLVTELGVNLVHAGIHRLDVAGDVLEIGRHGCGQRFAVVHLRGELLGRLRDHLQAAADFGGEGGDALHRLLRVHRQLADFFGHHGKAASSLAHAGGFDIGVERQQAGFLRDVLDDLRDRGDLRKAFAERLNFGLVLARGLRQLLEHRIGLMRLARAARAEQGDALRIGPQRLGLALHPDDAADEGFQAFAHGADALGLLLRMPLRVLRGGARLEADARNAVGHPGGVVRGGIDQMRDQGEEFIQTRTASLGRRLPQVDRALGEQVLQKFRRGVATGFCWGC